VERGELEIRRQAVKMRRGGFLRRAHSQAEVETWLRGQLFPLFRQYVVEVAADHLETLLRKRRNLLVRGDYGEIDPVPWFRELRYFLSDVCMIDQAIMELIGDALIADLDLILERVAGAPPPEGVASANSEEVQPAEYECLCAEHMRACGFDATLTKASGDQGVDVIARKPGLTVVLQCKYYSSPVGNKAVQEVFAGKRFVGADLAVVVSNNEFTDSARQLAQALGVLLLHDSQIRAYFGE